MRNIRLIIEYDGTGFNGWQAQVNSKKLRTIQEEIEKAAKKLLGNKISLIGASRTDSGVHAKAQAANFKTDSNLPLYNIKNGLNSLLPAAISIVSAEEAALNFHSRFDSKGKLYKYTIVNRKSRSPLLEKHADYLSYDLNISAMRKACRYLLGKKDFRSFQASDKKEKDSIRTVKKIEIVSRPPLVEIYVQADGFLYNMVRNIAGTLIEVGRGRFKPETVKEILEKRHRPSAGQTAPAKGLCLEKVFY
ncbi:MAG: tRNA pseudouridine(38-40) synthase TruA [Candidatus Omnitrophica bacterium CG02_land_8_20_14_3_00__42_8]|nr:MAG: tRNA pseudouridine(38-40) synthase TruA [Candidatus Omnitrophica bacterium CG02_land_8_20_14_3_00__42_8]